LLRRLPGLLVKRAILALLILVGLKMLPEQAGVF